MGLHTGGLGARVAGWNRAPMVRPPRFTPRRRNLWREVRPFVWLALLLGAVWLTRPWWQREAPGEWVRVDEPVARCGERPTTICAIDGDTLAWDHRRIRLSGYNAPELRGECPAESELAEQATKGLVGWLGRGPFEMDGGASPPRDKYGRELRRVRRVDAGGGSAWLAEAMVEARLGRSEWGDTGGGWC